MLAVAAAWIPDIWRWTELGPGMNFNGTMVLHDTVGGPGDLVLRGFDPVDGSKVEIVGARTE